MKYLGLTIDGRWKFGEHFRGIDPRAERMAAALARLLPNIGGPSGRVRRLYANVVHSLMLYGAPIWAEALGKDKRGRRLLERAQGQMCLRLARGYRTVARMAAGGLAGVPPLALLAETRSRCYWERKNALRASEDFSVRASKKAAFQPFAGIPEIEKSTL